MAREIKVSTERDNVISIKIVKKRFQIDVKKGVNVPSAFMTFVENDDLHMSFPLLHKVDNMKFARTLYQKKSNIHEFIMIPVDKNKCITKLLKEEKII